MKSEYSPRLLYPDILAGRSLIRVATLSSCNKKNQKKSITFCFLKYCALQNRDIIYSPIRVSSGCGPLPARDRLSPCCAVSKPRTWFRCFRRPWCTSSFSTACAFYDLGDDRNMHDGDDGNYGQCHDDQKKGSNLIWAALSPVLVAMSRSAWSAKTFFLCGPFSHLRFILLRPIIVRITPSHKI